MGRSNKAAISIRWYKCTFSTVESREGALRIINEEDALMAECADVIMPLCHAGICRDKSHEVTIFIKRLRARKTRNPPQALWMLQGGPGHSSIAMENLMINAYLTANETISVYTMDHRGAGRSTYLHCDDDDENITEEDIVACLQSIKATFGNDAPAGFSVTSAATDLKVLIESTIFKDTQVYVYGVSYGTYLVERLMHLEPKRVQGYILDSIQSEQFYQFHDAPYYSNWDKDVREVVDQFFVHCDADVFCKSKIGPHSKKTLQQTYLALDAGQSECFDVLYQVAHDSGFAKPSGIVAQTLYDWLTDLQKRVFIPAYIYRLKRCNEDDQVWLRQISYPAALEDIPDEGPYLHGSGYSDILYNNIVFSEIWQTTPTSPTAQQLYDDSIAALISLGNIAYAKNRLILYCLYKQNNDPVCDGYPLYDVEFTYNQDRYWNHSATIPPDSSVLLLSGALDPATPPKYARDELATLGGDNKRLLEFPFAAHGVLINSPDKRNPGISCGISIVDSYLAQEGNLDQIDLSCMKRVNNLTFSHWDRDVSFELFGSENPYNESAIQLKLTAVIREKLQGMYTTIVGVLALFLLIAIVALVVVARQNFHLRKQLQSKNHGATKHEIQPLRETVHEDEDELHHEEAPDRDTHRQSNPV